MKLIRTIAALAASLCLAASLSAQSIYDFKVKDMEGNDVSLSQYKGKVLLIVNT
ncbi:MAG: glutathione peroxidase, partial [Bacteroidales bacterium]|nr:glutathione peroxidase [Bacteroidales bacterium]